MSDNDLSPDSVQPAPEPLGGGAGDADRHEPAADQTSDAPSTAEDLAARLDPATKLGQAKG